jgi:hypothetical protein
MHLPRRFKVIAFVGGLLALALAAGLTARLLSTSREHLLEIPLPRHAQSISEKFTVFGLRREVSFTVAEEYPQHTVRDFFQSWADRSGWKLVPVDEDPWSVDDWQSFLDVSTGKEAAIDQWLVRWTSSDDKWDLRLALKYERPSGSPERPPEQAVYLAASRIGI